CRSYSGSANNIFHPQWGSSDQSFARTPVHQQSRSISRNLNNPDLPSPRRVSNAICAQSQSRPNSRKLTDLVWAFGQFLDHTIVLTPDSSGEYANMTTEATDPYEQYPNRTIPFQRSIYRLDSNDDRQQINKISSFIDTTNVYGYSTDRAYALRELDGSGKLKTTTSPHGSLLINNKNNLPNANPTHVPPEEQFLSGDIRVNETFLLISFHTLFTREHNRLCDQVLEEHPDWHEMDELIYQESRRRLSG
ncbi:unnamed protein product, partial [marine sediment metagenome]